MRAKAIRRMAGDPRFISGIYNYCDRWCERCSFTSRCLVYAMEQEETAEPAAHDIKNEAFWRHLQSIFEQTREMLADWCKQEGIDPESLDLESAQQEIAERNAASENHELSRAARRYAELAEHWLSTELVPFEAAGEPATPEPRAPAGAGDSIDTVHDLRDAVEVIRWYQYQVAVKIMRALGSTETDDAEGEHDWQKDSDGSIKVALIGMDRSISAWAMLRRSFPGRTDGIREILLHLERLRRRTEQLYPAARQFVRPGFDSVPSDRLH